MEGDIARDIQSPLPPENGSKQLGRSLWPPSDAIWSSKVHIAWENNSSWWIPRQCHTQELHEDRRVTPVYRITQSCWAPVNQKQWYFDKTCRKSNNVNFAQHHCATNFCICVRGITLQIYNTNVEQFYQTKRLCEISPQAQTLKHLTRTLRGTQNIRHYILPNPTPKCWRDQTNRN